MRSENTFGKFSLYSICVCAYDAETTLGHFINCNSFEKISLFLFGLELLVTAFLAS